MKKKGMELQISFVVRLILILAIFAGSIVMIAKFFEVAIHFDAKLKAKIIKDINEELRDGKVSIPLATREVRIGKYGSFGIGVMNLEGGTPSTFYYNLNVSKGMNTNDEVFDGSTGREYPECYVNGDNPYHYSDCFVILGNSDMEIDNYESDINWIRIWPQKTIDSGTYVIDVYICRDDANGVSLVTECDAMDSSGDEDLSELYDGSIHKIRINIP